MANELTRIEPYQITDNVFKLIADDWMLITAGTKESFNTMTASWGALGELWNREVCFVFVRPTRYTYEFMEKSEYFTLSFFAEEHREALNFCGNNSGRDVDKIAATKLTPLEGTTGVIYFAEARLVMECRKIYSQDLDPQRFLETRINKLYPLKDYHRLYVGEILGSLRR
jgi:flavin reductase (DIM6/NTAB) family NADH-FMN oxidoreductase RutF